jgi:hypothetical protein
MIIIQTKLKKIPEKCTKCKFSQVKYDTVDYWQMTNYRVCGITGTKVPYVFNKEKRNWEYTKASGCPLKLVEDNSND